MSAGLRSLLLHAVVGAAAALAVVAACALAGLHLSLPTMVAAGLATGAAIWLLRLEPSRADQLDSPPLDLDVDYALPHGQDIRVRRLEDMIHGAQPHRRMTSRGLALVLAEIAEERARDPDAPPPGPELIRVLRTVRAENATVPPIDRPTLHRILDELAVREERH